MGVIALCRIAEGIRCLLTGTWLYVTGVCYFYGGIHNSTLLVYLPVIIGVAWQIGIRAAYWVAACSCITALVLVLLEMRGVLPDYPPTLAPLHWVVMAGVFILTAVVIAHIVKSFSGRLEEVRELTRELQRAQSIASLGGWDYDIVADHMRLSAQTCAIFGLPPGTWGDYRSYISGVHEDDRVSLKAAWRASLIDGAVFDYEHRIRVGDSVRWVRQIAQIERDASGMAVRAEGTVQEITERKLAGVQREQLEAQLRESQKMEALGTLAGGVAHDFNNVLAAIQGNVALAMSDGGNPRVVNDSLTEISKASLRARLLIKQILAFGRRQTPERRRMALMPVVAESVQLLRASQPPQVKFSVECHADVPMVMADPTQMTQVLLNLCTNAWQAVENSDGSGAVQIRLVASEFSDVPTIGGEFALGVPAPGRYACLTVKDNGVGMDVETRRRLFEPFFTTKPSGRGTGLGMAVVHGILQSHGAFIEIDSSPGAGTAIHVYLPATSTEAVENADAPDVTRAWKDADLLQGGDKHVLYLDDDDALVNLATRLLQRNGYKVSGYNDPAMALEAVRANPKAFDLVITDYNMPGTSGLIVARLIREIRPDLPVVMGSGSLTADLHAEANEAGVRELLHKPDSMLQLCDVVARFVR